MSRIKWDIEKIEELKLLYKSNKNLIFMADYFNCSPNAIRIKLSNLGLTNQNRVQWSHKKIKELRELYKNPNFTIEDIAKHFGVTKDNIRRQASKNSIKKVTYDHEGKRECSRCGMLYPSTTEFFYRTKKNKLGLDKWCKNCWNDYKKEWKKKRNNQYNY